MNISKNKNESQWAKLFSFIVSIHFPWVNPPLRRDRGTGALCYLVVLTGAELATGKQMVWIICILCVVSNWGFYSGSAPAANRTSVPRAPCVHSHAQDLQVVMCEIPNKSATSPPHHSVAILANYQALQQRLFSINTLLLERMFKDDQILEESSDMKVRSLNNKPRKKPWGNGDNLGSKNKQSNKQIPYIPREMRSTKSEQGDRKRKQTENVYKQKELLGLPWWRSG